MIITITINTNNAAFEYNGASYETARTLQRLCHIIDGWSGASEFSIALRNDKGNTVGKCEAHSE